MKKTTHQLSLIFSLFISLFMLSAFGVVETSEKVSNANLRLEIINAYNLIVDSNVETPATYAPRSVHIGVQICNGGSNPMSNIIVNVGDFTNGTPGIYPERTVNESLYSGTFSLNHYGGTSDAVRYLKTLAPGECITQYWLVGYPNLDPNGKSVTGANADPSDDLWLNYDIWASAEESGTPITCNQTGKFTMRSEISASANKIQPNTTSKVPTKYLAAFADKTLGWRATIPTVANANIAVEGVWFDIGNIRKGFDNNGDFIPDYNFFLQPVGDPTLYDPNCFRLVKVHGVIIVKLQNGGEQIIPFEDRVYFENLPEDNTGAVGIVYYEFATLNGPCTSALTPYQEAASGHDNEKFNGDFGIFLGDGLTSIEPRIRIEEELSCQVNLGNVLDYTFQITNEDTRAWGLPALGTGLIIHDSIPNGLTYVSGSAANNNTLPTGLDFSILYATDNATNWTAIEPADPTTITDIQWILNQPLPVGQNVTATYQVLVELGYANDYILNEAEVTIGGAPPIKVAARFCIIGGNNTLSGIAFEDDGSNNNKGNGIYNTTDVAETGIENVSIYLYMDNDNDGVGDFLVDSTLTDINGAYNFIELPDAYYMVSTNGDLTSSTCNNGSCRDWINSTALAFTLDLDAAGIDLNPTTTINQNFGFVPALAIIKEVVGAHIVAETDEVAFYISVENNGFAGETTVSNNCQAISWAKSLDGTSNFETNGNNAIGAPNQAYAASTKGFKDKKIKVKGYDFSGETGAIEKVELVGVFYTNKPISDDRAHFSYDFGGGSKSGSSPKFSSYSSPSINDFIDENNVGTITYDITDQHVWNWTDFDGNSSISFDFKTKGKSDGSNPHIDAIGIRITKAGCTETTASVSTAYTQQIIETIPLTDTYDASKLQFISATLTPDIVTAGSLTWNNLGPLSNGEHTSILAYFKALAPTDAINGDTTENIILVSGATFENGQIISDRRDTAGLRIMPGGSISGTLWSDKNSGGWSGTTGFGNNEPKIANIEITLNICDTVDAFGVCTGTLTTETTITDENGFYQFDGLLANYHYAVEVLESSIPGAPIQTADPDDDPNNGSGDGGLCGTGAPCNNQWDNANNWFEMGVDTWGGASWDIVNINFGYSAISTIYGFTWEDSDGNGLQETGEAFIENITVELIDNTCTEGVDCPIAITDANGLYSFGGLNQGKTYIIKVVQNTLPAGTWTQTFETDGTIDNNISPSFTNGEISGPHDFAFQATGTSSIGDYIFIDVNGNGIQEAGEEPLANITIDLYEDLNADGFLNRTLEPNIATTTSAVNGSYIFNNLPAGDYLVLVNDQDIPKQYSLTADPDETGNTCSLCDHLGAVTVDGTTDALAIDFGFYPTGKATIGNIVWLDKNEDGIKSGEKGIANIAILLWADYDTNGNYEYIRGTFSDEEGNYQFTDLPDGNYRVIINGTDSNLPTDNFGNIAKATTLTTIDLVITNGQTISIENLPCVDCDLDLDFGFTIPGAIGGNIFFDVNGDGTIDWQEEGVPNVTVFLCTSNIAVCNSFTALTSTTTADGSNEELMGSYFFAGLTEGTYVVAVDTSTFPTGVSNISLTTDPDTDGIPCYTPLDPNDPNYDLLLANCDGQVDDIIVTNCSVQTRKSFGFKTSGSIGDRVWLDINANGLQEPQEIGIANMPLCLVNRAAILVNGINVAAGGYRDTTLTDINGMFGFPNIPDGDWQIEVHHNPTQFVGTYDADGGILTQTDMTIKNGSILPPDNTWCENANCVLDLDFGLRLAGDYSLTGHICIDDGSKDGTCLTGGEAPIDAIDVFLYDNLGVGLGAIATDSNGYYQFPFLPPNDYIIGLKTSQQGLNLLEFTTQQEDTPAFSLVKTTNSIYQVVALNTDVIGVDFAFISLLNIDFGDLPQPYPTAYENGAYHVQPTGTPTLFLGNQIDGEFQANTSPLADGDDMDNVDDEDGITFIDTENWTIGNSQNGNGGQLMATINGTGYLAAYMDFNYDGDFLDNGELVISQAVTAGIQSVNFPIPATATLATGSLLNARFRLFADEPTFLNFAFAGMATNGEVEDYAILLTVPLQAKNDTIRLCPSSFTESWVAINDLVPEGAVYTLADLPNLGIVKMTTDGSFRYTATTAACAEDVFSYRVCDTQTSYCDTATVTVIFQDDTAPTLTNIPDDITLHCDEIIPDVALVSAYDNCPAISIEVDEVSTKGDDGCSQHNYTLTRIWTATDICGNSTSEAQVITIKDEIAPDIFRVYTLPNGKKMVAGVMEQTGNLWKTISLPVYFSTPPLILAQVKTAQGNNTVVTQIRNISSSQFELQLQKEEGNNAPIGRENIAWIAIEAGNVNMPYSMDAQLISAGSNGQNITLNEQFTNLPAVFTTTQSTYEKDPSMVQVSAVTANAIHIKLLEETSFDNETNHINEDIAYLAIDTSTSLKDNKGHLFGESQLVQINQNNTTIQLSHRYHNPVIIAASNSINEIDPTTIRIQNVTDTTFDIHLQEWNYQDGSHATETVAYLVVEGSIPLESPNFCKNGTDSLQLGVDIIAVDNCDPNVEIDYEETTSFNGMNEVTQRIWSAVDACGNATSLNQIISCEGLAVQVKALLQGAMISNNGSNLMRDDLRRKGLLPLEEPYTNLAGFTHFGAGGGEKVDSILFTKTGEEAIVDWVLVEISASNNVAEIIATVSGLVQRNGDVISVSGDSVLVLRNIPRGAYYVSIRHRNHVGMTTLAPILFNFEEIPTIDFRNTFTPVKGRYSGMSLTGISQQAMWAGDLNGDGRIIYQGPLNDPFDMFLTVIIDEKNTSYLTNYISRGYTQKDFNMDGSVIFQGPNNDRSSLLFNTILAHPANPQNFSNFIISVDE